MISSALIAGIREKHAFAQDVATLDFIIYIINEPKLHLSCSLADLVTVSHLQCVALLYWENPSTYKLQEILSGQLEQWQTSSKQNASLKKGALCNF